MRISDWSSDVCSSDRSGSRRFHLCGNGERLFLVVTFGATLARSAASTGLRTENYEFRSIGGVPVEVRLSGFHCVFLSACESATCESRDNSERSEEQTAELPSLMRISYDVFFLKKKHNTTHHTI